MVAQRPQTLQVLALVGLVLGICMSCSALDPPRLLHSPRFPLRPLRCTRHYSGIHGLPDTGRGWIWTTLGQAFICLSIQGRFAARPNVGGRAG